MSDKNGVYLGSSLLGIVGVLILVGLIYFATIAQYKNEASASSSSEDSVGDRADVAERIKPIGTVKIANAEPVPATTGEAPATEEASSTGTAEAAAAGGEDPLALANASGCLACHQVDTKVVGPAYKDVAAKYKGDAEAFDKLVHKVMNGGSGTWGQVPMPPNAHVGEEKIRTLVKWILSL